MKPVDQFEQLSRERILTAEESDELCRLINREPHEPIYRRWTMDDNRELLKAARVRGGLKDYAQRVGCTYASAQTQLAKLKKQRKRRGIAFVGRFYYDGEVGAPSEVEGSR